MQIEHRAIETGASAPVVFHGTPDGDLGECLKLIRKLRWIGLEDEASRLQQALSGVASDVRGAVLADPAATD